MQLSKNAQAKRSSFSKSWIKYAESLDIEIIQARDEGRDLPPDIEQRAAAVMAVEDEEEREYAAQKFYRFVAGLPYRKDYPYVEPDEYEEILAQRNGEIFDLPAVEPQQRFDKVYGALLARCAGCFLGQPVEGWHSRKIIDFMKDTGNFPLNHYFRSDIAPQLRAKYGVTEDGYIHQRPQVNWGNNIDCAPEDDDTDWTILTLKLLEEIGTSFTPEDAGINWLNHFPMFHAAVSERYGYRNLANAKPAHLCGRYCNPYRETLGARIRADVFGYAAPGNPEKAASMAYREATLTNAKNGLYGAMFTAAMLACAAVCSDMKTIIACGLAQIPAHSRLYEAITQVITWYDQGKTIEEAQALIHQRFDEDNYRDWVHVVSNDMIVVMALLWGECNFEKSIGYAVMMGHDTDCNCATIGSVIGMILGANALPAKWLAGVNNHLYTCVATFDDKVAVDSLARRVMTVQEM